MKAKIGAVVLAAGTASRMGRQKLLLPLGCQPLLAHVLAAVRQVKLAGCVAVIGEPRRALACLCRQYGIDSVYNADRLRGQSSSVRLGLSALPPGLDGVLFFPGDQPLVPPSLVRALVRQFAQSGGNSIVVPACAGQGGSPVLFGAPWFGSLAALEGDRGGKSILRQFDQHVVRVEWMQAEAFWDADTPEDYRRLVRWWEEKKGALPSPDADVWGKRKGGAHEENTQDPGL